MTPLASTPIDPDRIARAVNAAHEKHKNKRGGKNASYIPALAEVDPQLFGVCVATVDGHTFSAGDADCEFALESISKVFTAALAMEQVGPRHSAARWALTRLARRSIQFWHWNFTTTSRCRRWSTQAR